MDDPIQRHPTRAEQLDILATVLADTVPAGGRLLDLGVGTGYGAHLVLSRRPDLDLVGIDLKRESLDAAKINLPNGSGGGRRDFLRWAVLPPLGPLLRVCRCVVVGLCV